MMVKRKNILFYICICFSMVGMSKNMHANGHFFAGALSGYSGHFSLPIAFYTLMNGYSYITTSAWKHTQDDIITFGKGAALGLGLNFAEKCERYLNRLATAKKKRMRVRKVEESQTSVQEDKQIAVSL